MTKYLACLLLASACGSRESSGTTPPTSARPSLPDVPFDELDHDQRIEFMKQRVVPTVAPIFAAHDPERFAELGCKTCHGQQADNGQFDMPSTDLPTLKLDDLGAWPQHDVEWMRDEVKPAMAALLSRTQSSPENPSGFGCGNCHPTE